MGCNFWKQEYRGVLCHERNSFDNYFWPYQSRIGWGVGYEETARWGLLGPKFDKEFKSKIISTKNRAKVFVFFLSFLKHIVLGRLISLKSVSFLAKFQF